MTNRLPKLPPFSLTVAVFDMLFAAMRLTVFTARLEQYPHALAARIPNIVLIFLIVAGSLIGGLGVLRRWRFAPFFQIAAQTLALFEVIAGSLRLVNQSMYLHNDVVYGLYGAVVIWSFVVFASLSRTRGYFRLLHSPREATVSDLAALDSNSGFEEFDFSRNHHIRDNAGPELRRQEDLVALDLSGTEIGDEGVRALARLPLLRWIDLSHTRVTDNIFRSLFESPSLEELRVLCTRCTKESAELFEKARRERHPDQPMRVVLEPEADAETEAAELESLSYEARLERSAPAADDRDTEIHGFLAGLSGDGSGPSPEQPPPQPPPTS